jgi:hypothetical protein
MFVFSDQRCDGQLLQLGLLRPSDRHRIILYAQPRSRRPQWVSQTLFALKVFFFSFFCVLPRFKFILQITQSSVSPSFKPAEVDFKADLMV